MAEVRIGGEPRGVPPLNMTKFRVAGKIISRLSEHLSEAMLAVAKFSQHYGEINKLPVTRKINEERKYGYTDADFQGRPYIEVPMPPSEFEQLAVGVASVYDKAEEDLARLAALVLARRDDVRDARRNDDVDRWLLEEGNLIMDQAEPEEFVELLTVAIGMARERFEGKDLLGKLRRAWNPTPLPDSSESGPTSSASGDETPADPRRMEPLIGTVTKDSDSETTSSGDSSSDSPEPSIGQRTPSSTTSTPEPSSATSS